jgi:uncharacterized protein YgiM (DUF1202 family)
MKKLIFTFALLVQTAFVFAADNNTNVVNARYENVKMYRQPGTSTEIIRSLKATDEVVLVRKFNANWSIITINEEVGYVLTSELEKPKAENNKLTAKR